MLNTHTRAYKTTHLPTTGRAQPGPRHLSQPQSHHRATRPSQAQLTKSKSYPLLFSHQKTVQTFLKSQGPICMRSSDGNGASLPKTGLTTLLCLFSTQLLSPAPRLPHEPVRLARWLLWNRFWSKFTHDYHLSVATGKL